MAIQGRWAIRPEGNGCRYPKSAHLTPRQSSTVGGAFVCLGLFLQGDGAKAQEQEHAHGLRAINGIKRRRLGVQRVLAAQSARNVRDEIEFAVITESIGLNPRKETLVESR